MTGAPSWRTRVTSSGEVRAAVLIRLMVGSVFPSEGIQK